MLLIVWDISSSTFYTRLGDQTYAIKRTYPAVHTSSNTERAVSARPASRHNAYENSARCLFPLTLFLDPRSDVRDLVEVEGVRLLLQL